MRSYFLCGFVTILFSISGVLGLPAADNPHPRSPCAWDSCHAKDPAEGDILLLKKSIDETCCFCHTEKCSYTEGMNHLSNVDQWDRNEFVRPKSLPLYDGFITCMTCHYRIKPQGVDYRMVRIVAIEDDNVTWEELCRDCHAHH
ncbi:MAG: hypothetical protein JSV26_05585 [bacterium]|nr:MAG: hypothetical protein JSV26_05585 [bacterium]